MSTIIIGQTMREAFQHHQAGRLAKAEELYRQVLQQQPRHADALHLVGVIALQTGRFDEAIGWIRKAVARRPSWPEACSNLGNALTQTGNLEEAVVVFRQALAMNPNLPGVQCNLGNALQAQGKLEEAVNAFRQAKTLQPGFAEAHFNLGNALQAQGRFESAIEAYEQAVKLNPKYAEANVGLGRAYQETGKLDGAIGAYRRAIALGAGSPDVFNRLGNALRAMGDLEAAAAAFRQAAALKPDYAEAFNNLGVALKEQGHLDEAVAAYQQAIALNPSYAEAHYNLGNVLHATGLPEGALASFRQALALNPDFRDARENLIFALQYNPACDAGAMREELREWNRRFAERLRKLSPHANDRSPERRLRVGYVSGDFWDHVVGRNVVPLFRQMNREHFAAYCYANNTVADHVTEEFRSRSEKFVVVASQTDEALAEQIRADGIDILVDLALHTAGGRCLLFARKPAPVQVCFAGYPGSTGLDAMDYRLTDPFLDPPDSGVDASYAEKSIRLPATFWCFDPLEETPPEVGSLPAVGNGYVTFGCLNNFCKVNEGVLRLWARVLAGVPESRLVMLAEAGQHRERTLKLLEDLGISRERLHFEAKRTRRQYLELYQQIDVGLDTLPYNGHSTSLDSYFMGVPVVTQVGRTVVGRAGLSQLTNLGLSELIGRTETEFFDIACGLARDVRRLSEFRAGLRERMRASPLMDAAAFARGIEAAYRGMWRQWCAGTSCPGT